MAAIVGSGSIFAADLVTSVPMETDGVARIKETVGGQNLRVYGRHSNENIPGAVGDALRFDGYSTYVEGTVPTFNPTGASSFSVWVAPETYPIVEHDMNTSEKATIAGTIDHSARSGWAFSLSKTGQYSFDCYAGGWLATVEANDLIPCYEWSKLVAVNDPEAATITLYRNGEQVGQAKSLGVLGNGNAKLTVGCTAGATSGNYLIKTFNGLIDEVQVYNGILSNADIASTPENEPDLTVSKERYAGDLLRPKYHGMPSANWTNECHGMTYSDGKYHLFFQKNANGPYMSRLHWGHISSENLYDWNEEKIAIAPSEDFDTKGAWSGCVFTDDEITGGVPNIIYTGVDYQRAYIVQAQPEDESLIEWGDKKVIINGKPSGLSDDFRDPYFFRNGSDAYLIVGTAKDGIGATTLHKYNAGTKTWSNDGSIFFAGTSTGEHGTFWEMPNVTPMGNGKWLFTVTPQNTSVGVHTMCWIGEINADGTFKPDSDQWFDLELVSQQGYGLLSPTIYQKGGKTLLMGIVPDKLSTDENLSLGWAHLYSFPREISIEEGKLIQKPFAGLEELRAPEGYAESNLNLDGAQRVAGIGGRQFEVKGDFTVGDVPFGFNIFKNGDSYATISYTPSSNRLEVNLTKLNRKKNDGNSYGGRYACVLPEEIAKGSNMNIDLWVDGSILDIFVNNKWATSIRVFPTDTKAGGVDVFSNGGNVVVNNLEGWLLGDSSYEDNGEDEPSTPDIDNPDAGIDAILSDLPEFVNVYNAGGVLVKRNVKATEALLNLPKGVYIIGNKKIML